MAKKDFCSEYIHCNFENWNLNFKSYIHKNIVLPVPDDVLNYIKSDIMVLPQNSMFARKSTDASGFWSETELELEEPNFSEFDENMKKAIKDLGGKVFIKLNWSAPLDASWITSTRTLCCSDPADIYLLLKSSTRISDDLSWLCEQESESANSSMCCLVLKKWEEIHPGTEFRCFVMDGKLIGICQRDCTSYFKYMNESKKELISTLTEFFYNHIKEKFILKCYTFDAVVLPNKKIILLDFGVLNKDSECLMFSLEELERKMNQNIESYEEPEFRYIDEHTNVTQNHCKHYGIPIDVVHFCNDKKKVMDFVEDEIIHKHL